MLFVCMAHFAYSYLFIAGAGVAGADLASVGMVASPTFVAVSGMVNYVVTDLKTETRVAPLRFLFGRCGSTTTGMG